MHPGLVSEHLIHVLPIDSVIFTTNLTWSKFVSHLATLSLVYDIRQISIGFQTSDDYDDTGHSFACMGAFTVGVLLLGQRT